VTFRLNVNNVAPTATFNAPSLLDEERMISLSLTNLIDPAGANDAPFQYAFDCDDGTG
jgi:hypothetical protein